MLPLAFYTTINYPTKSEFFSILDCLQAHNIGYVEIGIPVPNPYLDGEIIQTSHQVVLDQGIDHDEIVATLKKIRTRYSFKLILMTYSTGVDSMSLQKIPHSLYDALLCVDKELPSEQFSGVVHLIDNKKTVTELKDKINSSTPFVYVVSGEGKTGQFQSVPTDYIKTVQAINHKCVTPPFVGFGIQTVEDVQTVIKNGAQGAIIGTAFIKIYLDQGIQGIHRYLDTFKLIEPLNEH